MTALSAGVKPNSIPSPRAAHVYQRGLTAATIFYNGGVTAFDPATGLWVKPDGTKAALVVTGLADLGDVDHLDSSVAQAGTEMRVASGCPLLNSSGLSTANEGAIVYLVDDNTFSLAQGAGPVMGILVMVVDATHGYVLIDPIINAQLAGVTGTTDPVIGTPLTDAGSTAIARAGRKTWVTLPSIPLTANRSYALPPVATSAAGDEVIVTRLDVAAFTATFTDSGSGTATLLTMPASKINFGTFVLNPAGTHWLLRTCGTQ